ncbi:hypothetical protein R1sor_016878 [Riccia sorocarpa]|uniref:RING-type domain-containing protein n=1 Tax=Riccia sorocarpa TaxID=122646 RepID=A0ABD3HJL3_9MARC
MPAGLMVKAETKTLDILKSGRKWEVSLYPLVFDCNDSLTGWKEDVPLVPCAFCRGMISPGTDLRIPDCGHSYHVSCVCSCFGVNFLVCWEEQCSASIPLAWVKEFCLVRELDLKALHERLLCSVDMRSLPPSQFGDSDDLQIVGIPTMRLQKKKYLDSMHQELSDKTCAFIRSIKQGSRLKPYPPPHRVTSTQFRKWSQMEIGVKMIEWTHLWDYPSNKCWIFLAKCTPGETTCHNRALVTVAIDVPRGDDALQMLCKINMALCIRLRPWDSIFLELFAQALLVLQSKDSYKTDASYDALKPLWSVSKVWECDDPSHSRVMAPDTEADDSDHYCRPPLTLPPDLSLWLPTGAYKSSLPSSSSLPCTD